MPKPERLELPRGKGIAADYGPGQIHVAPDKDGENHLVNPKQACWCEPTVQEEGNGYTTHIHHPIFPVVPGHDLRLQKLHVVERTHNGKAHLVATKMPHR